MYSNSGFDQENPVLSAVKGLLRKPWAKVTGAAGAMVLVASTTMYNSPEVPEDPAVRDSRITELRVSKDKNCQPLRYVEVSGGGLVPDCDPKTAGTVVGMQYDQ